MDPKVLEEDACALFVRWLERSIIETARGDRIGTSDLDPSGRFWLGRLASEAAVIQRDLGDRGERLDPCAIGIVARLSQLPTPEAPIAFIANLRCRAWLQQTKQSWRKTDEVVVSISIGLTDADDACHGRTAIEMRLTDVCGQPGLSAEIRTTIQRLPGGELELEVALVNTSPDAHDTLSDTSLYECGFVVQGLRTEPFILEALPDSFRYDRRVAAYGINCGVQIDGDQLTTTDSSSVDRGRPTYWNVDAPEPDLRFETLASNPLPQLDRLTAAFREWGDLEWSERRLAERSSQDSWTAEMRREATVGANDFRAEWSRLEKGTNLLRTNERLLTAFRHMNEAIAQSSAGRYNRWRPFQIGFLLANLNSLVDPLEADTVDIVWFATGGGKTETYLGLVLTGAFLDRLRGKHAGITAWNRFPLRMLSLQQTQRFADAIAAAELVRIRHRIAGDPFSVGFLVGQTSTPNRIKLKPEGDGDPDADTIDGHYKILLKCPFCRSEALTTKFDHKLWRLDHICSAATCPWEKKPLPFHIVDDELYRFLPTVVVGTLDKAASIAKQATMRGFIAAPWGVCDRPGHGFTYAPRSTKPNGCLVPECKSTISPLAQSESLFPPTLRLQDELHLLKDSLGAVDAHYESLLDHLQMALVGSKPKIVGSSATLSGYQKQVETLYARGGRVFPALGPFADEGFWTSESDKLARRFVALAPRGATVDFAVDQTVTQLQLAIRRLVSDPQGVCADAGIDLRHAPMLLDRYGVDVVYGNTIRDLDAALRSFETQIRVDGNVNTASLTGRTNLDEVRLTLERLERPEPAFEDRLHVIAASAMMSHGVDIDRLNVLVIMGVPLTTAEFIQTSARVGRRYPGLVFIVPKMSRERDAGVFRSFHHFVVQGDRFVEPVPIGRRSRRVLARTLPGLVLARFLHIHEANAKKALTTVAALRQYCTQAGISTDTEYEPLLDMLGFRTSLDEELAGDLRTWLDDFFANVRTPPATAKFPDDLAPDDIKPMMSLRDVEEQVPIIGLVER